MRKRVIDVVDLRIKEKKRKRQVGERRVEEERENEMSPLHDKIDEERELSHLNITPIKKFQTEEQSNLDESQYIPDQERLSSNIDRIEKSIDPSSVK